MTNNNTYKHQRMQCNMKHQNYEVAINMEKSRIGARAKMEHNEPK